MDSDSDNDSDDDDNETMAISDDDKLLLRSIAPVSPSVVVKSTIPCMSTTKRDNRVAKKLHRKYNNQSDKKQRCLELYAYGYSYEKIAEILEIPESTIKLHHHHYSINKCGVTIKRAHPYPERRTDDVTKDLRKAFVENQIQSGIAKYRNNCVFIDEASVCASLRRNYAWAPVGKVAHVTVPQLRTSSKTIIAAICHIGIVELCVKTSRGGTKTCDFYAFLSLIDYQPTKQNEMEMEVEVEDDEDDGDEKEEVEDEMEQRLKRAMSKITVNDFESWINHSKTFFDRCLAREDNL
ncbi:hypothetical protein BDC45DRAFT_576767 [Circinella umbellata]|nr:hypothetical protein BDC45DRAFT_576767 [Circinella umbellata]